MKKTELLSPAGNLETLKVAVQNGADAIYMAGKKFGARAFSENFNDDEIIEAINYCHLYGVKIYITINTIVYDDEVEDFINYVDFIYKNGVDAVIIQDLGMADLIHKTFPNLEMHASTQMNVHNINGLKFLKEIGFKRVVLAREVPIETIKKMKEEVDIELEVFVHGALCISCSGECYFSYFECNRSGNRGKCAQVCRQPYTLLNGDKKVELEDKYLLSPKDLCTINNLDDLIKIGVDSFKIEGRMKSKEYVGLVTRCYRNKIDYDKVSDEDITNMKKVFNRGFTLGNLYSKRAKEFINGFRPNHLGVLIGEVIDYKKGKVKIKLSDYINQGDAVRFIQNNEIGFYLNRIYKNDLLVNGAKKGEIVEFDSKEEIKKGTKVYKTIDIKLNNYINEKSINLRKVLIDGEFKVQNNKIIFTVTDKENTEKIILNDSVFKAKNKPTLESNIKEKLNKLGNDIYVFDNLKIDIPSDIFIPMTTINNLRRDIIKKLTDDRIRVKNNYQKNNVILNKSGIKITNDIFFEVQNKEQLEYILDNTDYKCYVNNALLYSQYKNNDRIIFKMPRINNSNIKNENTLISEIGEITKNTITDTYFNVVNSYYVNFLYNKGVKKVTLSYELTIENIENLIKNYKNKYNEEPNLEVVIYGKPELMISKYCLLNTYVNKEKICNECAKDYYLVDKYNKKFPIRSENCYMKILNYKDINYLDKIDKLQSIGVTNYKIILDRENIEEIKLIISALKIKENIL